MIRDDPQQAVHFISLHWSQASRGEAAPAIQLWVDEQKAIASKKEPLSQKQLLKNNTQCMDQRTAHQPEHLVRGKATAEAEEVSPAKAAGIVLAWVPVDVSFPLWHCGLQVAMLCFDREMLCF